MFDFVERFFYWFSSFFLEGDVDAYCQVAGVMNDDVILTTTEDMMSVVEIRGARRLMGHSEYESMAEHLSNLFIKIMKSGNGKQHSFAIGYRSSPESSKRLLSEIFRPNLMTLRRFGSVESILIDDQIKALSEKCREETMYIILMTHKSGLSAADRERFDEWRTKTSAQMYQAAPGTSMADGHAQNLRLPPPVLMPRHQAALKNFVLDLERDVRAGGVGVLAHVLSGEEGLSLMRRHLDASNFDSSWRPRLIGGKSSSVVLPGVSARKSSGSHLMPMRLSRQMVSEPLVEVFGDVECAKRLGLYYAGIVLDVPPESGSAPFSELMERIDRSLPFSVNMEIVSNGVDRRKMDLLFAGFVGAMGDYNKRVKEAWALLKKMKQAGTYIGAMRVTMVTWAASEEAVVLNLSILKSSVESWDSCVASNETGSPGLLALSAAAGFTNRLPASYIPAPMYEIARMAPVFSSASVWSDGQLITHTKEGRPYPVAFGSTMQNFWGTLIFAPSGFGKSFLMNTINMGIMLSPGLENLPYLTVIDVGPSSSLVMDLTRSVLPAHLARQVISIRIRNDEQFSVNPFDTQLGCERPTEVDRDFQVCVVSTVCIGLGPEGDRFIGQVIDEAYKMYSRQSPSQRRWEMTMHEGINAALTSIGFRLEHKTFVWEVVDALFMANRIDDASIAQRFAVPRMADLIKACRTKEMLDTWGKLPTPLGELVIDVFSRCIQTAQAEYSLVCGVTQFDIGSARAISIDLEEVVTGSESDEGKRRAAMMFLFARRLGAKNYFLRWDEIASLIDPRYHAYQFDRIKRLEESLKFLEYDEMHYASGIPSMARRVQEDLRVGRKYKCVTMMASQQLADFPSIAVDNCYSYFILGAGADSSLSQIESVFGLSASESYAIQSECNGPGRLFGMFKTVKGKTSQVLYTTAGSFTKWAFSTSKDDALLRSALTRLLDGDYLAALKALSAAYPSGSARDEMEKYRRSRTGVSDGEFIIDVFARKVAGLV